jgi:ABC-2 type transport system permease protein
VSAFAHERPSRIEMVTQELAKLPAFMRRDLLSLISYRTGFASDWIGLAFQIFLLHFVGKLVDSQRLPTYAGQHVTYLEFAAVGIAMGMFVHIGLNRVATAIRMEQMVGTLESVLVTPTAPGTIQLGSAMFDVVYVPLRTAVFLGVVAAGFGLHFSSGGIAPAAVVLLAFAPVVWGLGLISAAGILTFRRGAGIVGIGGPLLTLSAGAYFPLSLLPAWLVTAANLNPLAIALNSMRRAVLGNAGWTVVPHALAVLLPTGIVALVVGAFAFRIALARERRLGTLGLY